jgi:hypothetical protein
MGRKNKKNSIDNALQDKAEDIKANEEESTMVATGSHSTEMSQIEETK